MIEYEVTWLVTQRCDWLTHNPVLLMVMIDATKDITLHKVSAIYN